MRRSNAKGFTLVEIMIVVAIIALLAAIAIPNVLRGRTTANEAAAIGNLRALLSSVEMYRSVQQVYPNPQGSWVAQVYTTPDPDFGPPAFNLAMDNTKVIQGFKYQYTSTDGSIYDFNAHPSDVGTTGTRSFWTDETGQVYHCNGDNAAPTRPVAAKTIDQQVPAC